MTPADLRDYYLSLNHEILDDDSVVINDNVQIGAWKKNFDPMNPLKSLECGLVIRKVNGYFEATECDLESLEGFPLEVSLNVMLDRNKLKSLKGIGKISHLISVDNNQLENLQHLPNEIGSIHASDNHITTLKGSPDIVHDLLLNDNRLTNLDGCPSQITGDFHLNNNPDLTTLEGSPSTIGGWEYECYNCDKLKFLVSFSKDTHIQFVSSLTPEQEHAGFLAAWKKELEKNPERLIEMPTKFYKELAPKLANVANIGVLEHLKTFEEFDLYDTYLENSNEVKEILSHFKIKYEIFDENPTLRIIFPYSASMYGGRWIDTEYKLIESFMKELLRYDFTFKVDETEETTTIRIDC